MSARIALYIAAVLLVLIAVAVIAVAALVQRPRREWEVAVRGQTQEIRFIGMPSLRAQTIKPRRISLDEMWATHSVPESAYVGAPKIPDKQAVVAALAPAPAEAIRQYQGVFLGTSVKPPTMLEPQKRRPADSFYEPEVTSGEISLFNAALDRPVYDDDGWDEDDQPETLGLARAKEVIADTTATFRGWLQNLTGPSKPDPEEPDAEAAADASSSVEAVELSAEESPHTEIVEVEPPLTPPLGFQSPAAKMPPSMGIETVEEEAEEYPSVPLSAGPTEPAGEPVIVEVQDEDLETAAGALLPPPPPPTQEDLEDWVQKLGQDTLDNDDAHRRRWRRPELPGSDTESI